MDIKKYFEGKLASLHAESDFSFARHTTIGTGGIAALALSPASSEEAVALVKTLKRQCIPYCHLGVGANVLPADGYFDGVVVRTNRLLLLEAEGTEVFCGAGVTSGCLLAFAKKRGIGGFEFLTGIPSSLGGAAVMNAGVKGKHLSDVTLSVLAVEGDGVYEFPAKECGFSEKTSVFQSGMTVVGVRLKGHPAAPSEIEERENAYRAKRAHLPKGRSMGCVFVNPEGHFAGKLIEDCGLKGLSVGKAFVSSEHANFIINGGATSEEIAALIRHIKTAVFERTGILLREEIRYIP